VVATIDTSCFQRIPIGRITGLLHRRVVDCKFTPAVFFYDWFCYDRIMFEVGQKILDTYVIEKFLGAGGAGEVFLVRRIPDDMLYAVKTIPPAKVKSAELRQDLLREMRVSRYLGEHPHIVPSRFFRIIDGSLAVFSDYVEGGTLHTWISTGKIERKARLLDIAIQMAWGLDIVHTGGILHKDIKPANILMEPDGRARIADFGLIRGMTPAFCSPEQVSDADITPATDIWSWALVVMHMWFGECKWKLGFQAPLFLEHLRRDGWSFGAAPDALITLLSKCLRNDPVMRPATARCIADTLKSIYACETGTRYPRPDPPEPSLTASRPTAENARKSVIDGTGIKDPRDMLENIRIQLQASDSNVERLIPEVNNPPDTFVDDLHVYLFIEDILRKASAEGNPDWLELLAEMLQRKAFILFDSGDHTAAIAAHEQAVALLKETILWHNRPELWKKLAEHWADIAFCNLQSEKPENAVTSIRNAERALDKVPESMRQDSYYFGLQVLRTNQAIISALTGDTDAATRYFEDALRVLDHIDAEKYPIKLLRNKSQSEFNLGTHFEKIGKPETGIPHFLKAIKYQDKLLKHETSFHDQLFMATICQNLAVCLADLKRTDAAEFFFRKAGDAFRTALSETNHHFVQRKYAIFLKNYGYFHFENGNLEKAVELTEQALAIMTAVLQKEGILQYGNLLVEIYTVLADYCDRMNLSEKAREYRLNADKFKRLT
jgi:serine/threonine protein kinase